MKDSEAFSKHYIEKAMIDWWQLPAAKSEGAASNALPACHPGYSRHKYTLKELVSQCLSQSNGKGRQIHK